MAAPPGNSMFADDLQERADAIQRVAHDLGKMVGNSIMADCQIVLPISNGARIPAHQTILALRAPMLHAKISSGNLITMPQVAADTMKIVLHYIYTDNLPNVSALAVDKKFDLVRALHGYKLERLRHHVLEDIAKYTTLDTMFDVLKRAMDDEGCGAVVLSGLLLARNEWKFLTAPEHVAKITNKLSGSPALTHVLCVVMEAKAGGRAQVLEEYSKYQSELSPLPSTMHQDLTDLYNNTAGPKCDAHLKTPKGQKIDAHRFFLAARSRYFEETLNTPLLQDPTVLDILPEDKDALTALVEYLYFGNMPETKLDSALAVLRVFGNDKSVEGRLKITDCVVARHQYSSKHFFQNFIIARFQNE